ncbi:MAG: hypothetical protein V4694_00860 [Pseudomonadota bacterium]
MTDKKNFLTDIFCIFLAAIPASIILIYWHFLNKEYPISDASEYWSVALQVFNYMKEHSFWKWYEFYSIRTWKPIIFPQIGAIFLIISNGNTFFMTGATHFLFNLLLCIWLYQILRLYTDRLYAVIATILLSTIPTFLGLGFLFYGDVAFYSLGVGVVCHLIKSQYFTNKFHSICFAITLAFAACVRPVETVTILILPLAIYYYRLSKFNGRNFYKLKPILILIATFLVAFGAAYFCDEFFQRKIIKRSAEITLTLSTLFLIFRTVQNFRQEKDHFLKALSLSLLLILLWWMDDVAQLYNWVHECTVGESAKNSRSTLHQEHLFGSIHYYLKGAGYFQILLPLILLTIVTFITSCTKEGRAFLKKIRNKILKEPIFLFSFLSFILLMVVISPTIPAFDARRGLLSYQLFGVGILILLFVISSKKKIFYYPVLIILAAFCTLQTSSIYLKINAKTNPLNNVSTTLISGIESLVLPAKEASSKIMIEWLYDNYLNNNPNCTAENPCNVLLLTNYANPFTIMMLNNYVYQNKGVMIRAQYVSYLSDSILQYHEWLKSEKNQAYIFMEVDPEIKEYNTDNTSNYYFYFYGNMYRRGDLAKFGLYEIDKNKVFTFGNKRNVMLTFKKPR